ncbi:MAG: DUF4340 domain-containing protein [Limisphaerales bacterium]
MNRKTTAWLVTLALALAAFILLVERPRRLARARAAAPQPVLGGLDPAAVFSITVRWTNLLIEAVRSNGTWHLVQPVEYPGHPVRIRSLLDRLAALRGHSVLPPAELRARPDAAAAFGLAPAQAALVLRTPAGGTEVHFGLPVFDGGAVHLQALGRAGIFTADISLFDALPRRADDWRDPRFLPPAAGGFDRLRVTSPAGAWTLTRTGTNDAWQIIEPRPARADVRQVEELLRGIEGAMVGRFVTDTPPAGLEAFGLRPPQATLAFGTGTNFFLTAELGGPATNAAGAVYARRSAPGNLVAVPAALLALVRVPYTALLDRRLLDVAPASLASVRVTGTNDFTLARAAGGDGWRLTEGTNAWDADPGLAAGFLARLTALGMADVAKEVVTELDLARFGLAPPRRSFTLLAAGSTNPLARLDLGTARGDRVHARRLGEPPVYEVLAAELAEVDVEPWELRDLGLWSFPGTNVVAVLVQHGDQPWSLTRQGTNHWELPPLYRNEVNPFALDEALHRLGSARALGWVARNDAAGRFGLSTGIKLTLEFRTAAGTRPPPLLLDFGKRSPRGNVYARAGGAQAPVFEFAGPVFDALWSQLRLPGGGPPPP